MNAELRIELSPQQQELILRGLRYVRSSVALEAVDWSPEVEANRSRQYAEIRELEGLLNVTSDSDAATV